MQADGSLDVILSSTVAAIHPESVEISCGQNIVKIANDAVIVCAGGILPTAFLKSFGVSIETKHGVA